MSIAFLNRIRFACEDGCGIMTGRAFWQCPATYGQDSAKLSDTVTTRLDQKVARVLLAACRSPMSENTVQRLTDATNLAMHASKSLNCVSLIAD